jgi:hypothetical protein
MHEQRGHAEAEHDNGRRDHAHRRERRALVRWLDHPDRMAAPRRPRNTFF